MIRSPYLPPLIPAEALFRRFVVQDPLLPFSFTFRSFSHVPLEVRALSSSIVATLRDDEATCTTQLFARSVYCNGRRLFLTLDEILDLPDPEVDSALALFVPAFSSINPTYNDYWIEWRDALREGARHDSNSVAVVTIGGCVDPTMGGGLMPRPDRYFGKPMCDLSDGQMMAFEAARHVYRERYNHG